MNMKTLGVLNLLGLVLLFLGFVPYNDMIAQVLFLAVALVLLLQR